MSNNRVPRWEKTISHHSQYVTKQNTWVPAGAVQFYLQKNVWTALVRGVRSSGIRFATEADAKAWVEMTVGLIGG